MWWVYALLSAVFASLTAIFAKLGVTQMNASLATAIRTAIILLLTWGIVLYRKEYKGLSDLSGHNLFFLTISGLATGLSWLFYFKALQLGKVSQVAPVDKLSVALTLLLSVIFLGEALSWKSAAGAALIISGTLVMIW